jgi:RNA polymerase sigma factor (sigma-70 family)
VTEPRIIELTLRHDFERFCHERLAELRRVVAGMCRDEHLAQDVVSETVMAARDAWDSVGCYDNPMGWLVLTARNKAREAFRRAAAHSRRTCRIDDLTREPYVEPILEAEDLLTLHDSVRRLPERQAQVFVLSFAGWTDRDIGLELHIAPATVRNHLRMARIRLRAILDPTRAEAS